MMSAEKSAWEKVGIARLPERPTAKTYIDNIFTDFIELHGDRCFGDDTAIIGGIGRLNGRPVTIIGEEKGGNTKEKLYRNFGCPNPEGYRKSLRLMKQAEKFKRPIICFVDTQGAFCGIGAEERGQGEAIADNLISMVNLKVPIISVVIGEGGSGGALALAVADKVWMLENSTYSILSPEGFASILWKDAAKAEKAAEAMKLTASDLFKLKVIDKIIKEPDGGAHKNVDLMVKNLREELVKEMESLVLSDVNLLLKNRYEKFRKMGSQI
ncbi:acetyl-CoA carboxylase carboxyltransferase subunit alpha [Clostridium oryzae]|uniref:Acetyl-coenzyme A carboxylase carboxyl transferase subunit alpha n=1 Tax=Clostridium oryzae TaxID=1450648 RepID=A0A1V4IUZ9_9CLOT|nr:acetyl-CoA carboxylase carboxyltransferase subunit alpha [Clostridium oryzae]OPJ63615.1 acetyl-coenzyme A carboxylase carboxyl transferase subunit alpha [Clostridium oryzae]